MMTPRAREPTRDSVSLAVRGHGVLEVRQAFLELTFAAFAVSGVLDIFFSQELADLLFDRPFELLFLTLFAE